MKKQVELDSQSGAFTIARLVDEATQLMRRTPTAGWAAYAVGTLPFLLLVMYAWSELSFVADAEKRLPRSAALLVIGFVWMKTWQSVFCATQFALLRDEQAPPLSLSRLLKIGLIQGICQSLGLVLLPFCLVVALPFGRLYAYYNSLTVFAGVADMDYDDAREAAWDVSRRWRLQNLVLIWLFSPWLLICATAVFLVLMPAISANIDPTLYKGLNFLALMFFGAILILLSPVPLVVSYMLAAVLMTVPMLARALLGVETAWTMSPDIWNHSSFTVIVIMLTYLLLDPLLKTAYTLRSFYGFARTTGEDILAELSREQRRMRLGVRVLVLACLLLPGLATAQEGGADAPAPEPPAATQKLNEALDDVLERPEFAWRTKRESDGMELEVDPDLDLTWLEKLSAKIKETAKSIGEGIENFFDGVGESIDRVIDWFRNLRGKSNPKPAPPPGGGGGFGGILDMLASSFPVIGITLLVALLGLIMYVVWRVLRRAKPVEVVVADDGGVVVVTEEALATEEIAPDALPESGWRAMASDLIDRGEYRLAMRALYLASLSFLGEQGLVALRKSKSNREYLRELDRRAHALPGLLGAFRSNVQTFETSWYGDYPVTRERLDNFIDNLDRIRSGAEG